MIIKDRKPSGYAAVDKKNKRLRRSTN